ncbi:MAG TPA: glutamate--tRNA ligase [Candidatus Paceibacterota bacterium]|nr:glutamate--tRNA ligase [Candidatus Paceibacterota bacterium]
METPKTKAITRFPPSPTGNLHVGGLRTALFNYLYAKRMGGEMVFRIEDTDKERSKKEYEQNILDSLNWVGIKVGEPWRQSERTEVYKGHLKKMIDSGLAYISKETPKEEGERAEVIRFKNPNKKIAFEDLILGTIEVDTTDLGDFVIAKDLETPLYHLAVVVDDFDMGVTHIIRGQEHIANTPRQILIQEAIGAPRPFYGHIPLILAPDKTKLSKRHGAVSVTQYKDEGYLPEVLVNFLALIGWNPGNDREFFTLDELCKEFSLEKVQKSSGVFDVKKLNWMNKEYIKKLPKERLTELVLERVPKDKKDFPSFSQVFEKILPIIVDRIERFDEVTKMFEAGEFDYFFADPVYEKSLLKNTSHLPKLLDILGGITDDNWNAAGIKSAVWDFATEVGRGEVLWPMRVSLSGREKSPDPFTLAEVLGKEETVRRIKMSLE